MIPGHFKFWNVLSCHFLFYFEILTSPLVSDNLPFLPCPVSECLPWLPQVCSPVPLGSSCVSIVFVYPCLVASLSCLLAVILAIRNPFWIPSIYLLCHWSEIFSFRGVSYVFPEVELPSFRVFRLLEFLYHSKYFSVFIVCFCFLRCGVISVVIVS